MKEIAFFMLPLGALSAALLSVPWQGLQRSCINICNLRISLGRYFSLRLCTAFLIYNLLRFVIVCAKLMGGAGAAYARLLSIFPFLSSFRIFAYLQQFSLAASPSGGGRDNPAITAPTAGFFPIQAEQQNQLHALYDIRVQARVLRYQRDFWITLFAAFLWLFVCWAAFLIRRYWRRLEQAHESYENVLQEHRRIESVAASKAATTAARLEKELMQPRGVKEVELTRRGIPAREKEKIVAREETGGKKIEVELTSMATEEMKEEETTVAGAEEEKEETPVAATTTRRRRVPADSDVAVVCRQEVRERQVLD